MGRGTKVLVAIFAVIACLIVVQGFITPRVLPDDGALTTDQISGALTDIVTLRSSPELRRATVTLKDGTKIEAPVIPGCTVNVGDTVRVLVTHTKAGDAYLVLGAL